MGIDCVPGAYQWPPGWMHDRLDEWVEGQTDGWTDGQMGGWMHLFLLYHYIRYL